MLIINTKIKTNKLTNKLINSLPIIIDSDMGPDDWVAILYLAQFNEVDLRIITISGTGESHGFKGAMNCLRLLKFVNKENIPVAFGRATPLLGDHHFPKIMRYVIDKMLFLNLPKTSKKPMNCSAVELLKHELSKSSEKITVLAIGPLTNIAELIIQAPELKEKISKIYIMGGAVNVAGNIKSIALFSKNQTAEWNIYCDPHAANIVLQSGIPLVLIPLDATNAIPVEKAFIEKLNQNDTNSVNKFCYKVVKRLTSRVEKGKYFLWDVIAAIVMCAEFIATFESYKINVVEEEGEQSGRTKIDEVNGVEINVCTKVNQIQFESLFMKMVK